MHVVGHILGMLNLQNVGVLLSVCQHHCYLVGMQLVDVSLVKYGVAHIGNAVGTILIEINHVAAAEVWQEAFALSGHGERYAVGHGTAFGTLLCLYCQAGVYVAGLQLSASGMFQRSAEQLVTPSCEPTLPKSCSRYTNVIMRQKYSRSNGGMAANGPVTVSICGRR